MQAKYVGKLVNITVPKWLAEEKGMVDGEAEGLVTKETDKGICLEFDNGETEWFPKKICMIDVVV